MGRQISVEILPPHLLCLFHRFIKCPGAFHEHGKYFYEAAFERDLHGLGLNGFQRAKMLQIFMIHV